MAQSHRRCNWQISYLRDSSDFKFGNFNVVELRELWSRTFSLYSIVYRQKCVNASYLSNCKSGKSVSARACSKP